MSPAMRALIAEFDKQWDLGLRPDVADFIAAHASLSPSQWTHLLLIDQSRRWAGGEHVPADDYFQRFPELMSHPESAIDLLFAEYLLRHECDPTLEIDSFANRYPQFADELCRQIQFHRTIGMELMQDISPAAPFERQPGNADEIGRDEVPGYEILGELGRGGLGVVYLALNLQLNRKVALKMLLAGRFASDQLIKRLMLEAEATARLQHPSIVQIYEVGQHAGHPFLALEYVSGGTLAQWMERRPQSPRDAAQIVHDIACAIQFAHEKGIIHRDLKPSNLLIQKTPGTHKTLNATVGGKSVNRRWPSTSLTYNEFQIKIADFGLAKFVENDATAANMPTTMTGDLMGTAAYMSPEQARGGRKSAGVLQLTESTDIYSLGAILYELLTGRPPFVGIQPLEILSQVLADEPVPLSQLVRHIPKDLQTICLKCLEKNPARRYATAEALSGDLLRFLSNQPILARRTSMLERSWRWFRRNPVKTTLAMCAASLLLMVASLSSFYSILLSNQLAITAQSEITQKSLKMEAIEQLWEASLSQAAALRTSRQVGQRFESLKAIDTARELGDSLQFKPEHIDRMRNETVAALALSDIHVSLPWKTPWPPSVNVQAFDQGLEVCAYLLSPTLAIVQRISDGTELARFENVEPNSRLVLSRDGNKLAIIKDTCRVYCWNSAVSQLLFETTSSGPWDFNVAGSQLIGIDGDGELKLVDLQNPLSIVTIGNFRSQNHISMSPNSRYAALWMEHAIQVVDLQTAQTVLRVAAPALPFYQSFEWHPSSKILAIRSDQRGIELWNVAEGERLGAIAATGPARFAFDAQGDRLLTNQLWSDTLQLWGVSNGELELSQKGEHILQLAAEPAGGFILIQAIDRHSVARGRITCPTVYQTLPALRKDAAVPGVPDIAYSPDGRFLAYSSRGELEIFDPHTMTSLASADLPSCFLQFASDGSLVTSSDFGIGESGTSERGFNRWKLASSIDSDSTNKLTFGPPESIYDPRAGFSNAPFDMERQANIIAAPMLDGVCMWFLDQEKSIRTQATHADVRRVSMSPDGKRVASAGWNSGNVCVWDTATGQLQHTIFEPSMCTAQFSPDGELLATNAGEITIWETQTWRELYKVDMSGKPNSGVSVCFSPDSRLLIASDALGRIHLIDARSGREQLLLIGPTEKQVNSLRMHPTGTQLVVLPDNGTAHVWNLNAIQAELDARNLSWQTGAGIAPQLAVKSAAKQSASQPDPPKLPQVVIRLDERFRQLAATQQIAQADVAANRFDFDSARQAIARALKLSPQNPQDCNRLAWLLATGPVQLRDPERAISLARTAVQHCRESERSLYANTLGVAQYRAGKFQEALETLQQSLASQAPNSQAFDLFFMSMCSSKLGNYLAARDYFERAQVLKAQYRSQLSFDQQTELDEFSEEAELLVTLQND
jgi:eukaryotic-like serine/threonine-protein kinase